MIASGLQLEVYVGEPEELHLMSLYEINGTEYATFTVEDPTSKVWVPIPVPSIFANNPAMFEEFKTSLSRSGYTFRDVVTANLQ
jgi:hypothetical protein